MANTKLKVYSSKSNKHYYYHRCLIKANNDNNKIIDYLLKKYNQDDFSKLVKLILKEKYEELNKE